MQLIDKKIISNLFEAASASERKRSHLLLHKSHSDKVQRLLIAMVKNSFVEPHFHELATQWEMFSVLEGRVEVTLYDKHYVIVKKLLVGPEDNICIIEFSPGEIHSVECLSETALLLEIKEGPFDPKFAKSFIHSA